MLTKYYRIVSDFLGEGWGGGSEVQFVLYKAMVKLRGIEGNKT